MLCVFLYVMFDWIITTIVGAVVYEYAVSISLQMEIAANS